MHRRLSIRFVLFGLVLAVTLPLVGRLGYAVYGGAQIALPRQSAGDLRQHASMCNVWKQRP